MNLARILCPMAAVAALGACMTPTSPDTPGGALAEVPEGVVALAAPNQDLSTVRIEPADGCYWYLYQGPVETTYLPLRSKDGRPICSRPQEVEAPGGGGII